MELELKHLAPYLPYDLQLNRQIYKNGKSQGTIKMNTNSINDVIRNVNKQVENKSYFPILRPLSDIDKEVWVNGVLHFPKISYNLVKDEENIWCDEFGADYGESPSAKIPVTSFNFWLFELHFDVFGLIDAGLAIDINKLEIVE